MRRRRYGESAEWDWITTKHKRRRRMLHGRSRRRKKAAVRRCVLIHHIWLLYWSNNSRSSCLRKPQKHKRWSKAKSSTLFPFVFGADCRFMLRPRTPRFTFLKLWQTDYSDNIMGKFCCCRLNKEGKRLNAKNFLFPTWEWRHDMLNYLRFSCSQEFIGSRGKSWIVLNVIFFETKEQ